MLTLSNFMTYSSELDGRALVDAIKEAEPDVPVISFSQIATWDRCELQWYLGYVEQWEPIEKSERLELGSLIHEDLKTWYTTHDKQAVRQMYTEHFNAHAWREGFLEFLAEETWLIDHYMNWSPTQDGMHEIVAVEQHFIIALYTPKGRKFYLQGYIDLLTRDRQTGKLWIWDHKSGTKFWSFGEIQMHPQFASYAAAYSIYLDQPIHGILINMLNTYLYKERDKVEVGKLFRRETDYMSHERMANTLFEVGRAVDDMIDARGGGARRRLTRDCAKFCDFRDPCLFGLKGQNMQAILPTSFRRKGTPKQGVQSGPTLNIHL